MYKMPCLKSASFVPNTDKESILKATELRLLQEDQAPAGNKRRRMPNKLFFDEEPEPESVVKKVFVFPVFVFGHTYMDHYISF